MQCNGRAREIAPFECTDPSIGELNRGFYLFERLCAQEKERFEEHTSECLYCADQVRQLAPYMKIMRDILREEPELLYQALRAETPERVGRGAVHRATVWGRVGSWVELRRPWALAAAAMFFLALVAGYFHPPAAWRAAGLIASEAEDGARFRKQSPDLADGIQAFQAHQLATAIGKLQAVGAKDDRYYVAQYFLGLCYLSQSDSGFLWARKIDPSLLNQAIGAFQRSINASERDPLYEARARLALAKAYLLTGEREKVLAELAMIERLPGPQEQIGTLKQTARALKRTLP